MQKKLLEICKNLKETEKNEQTLKKLEIIEKMLNIENCFFYLTLDTSIDILTKLGFQKDEALKIYKQETSFNKINRKVQKWHMKKQ